jgi:succinyl-CoA synthetase beta subunit
MHAAWPTQVNPLAEDAAGNLIAADAKMGFDDNAEFRQKDIFAMKDDSQIDPREVAAAKVDLNYIGLDGYAAGLALKRMQATETQATGCTDGCKLALAVAVTCD